MMLAKPRFELSDDEWEQVRLAESRLEHYRRNLEALKAAGKKVWYAVNVNQMAEFVRVDVPKKERSRIEYRVRARLFKRGVEAIVPLREERVRDDQKRGRVYKQQPAIPNIVFIRIPVDIRALHGMRSISGVTSIIGNRSGPTAIANELMEGFVDLAEKGFFDQTKLAKNKLAIGDEVAITDGPFVNFPGIIRALPDRRLALVEAFIFGREARLNIDLLDLKKI